MGRRVVITGAGMVTPIGKTASETWSNLLEGKSGIRKMPQWAESMPQLAVTIAGKADYEVTEFFQEEEELKWIDLYTVFSLAAAREALQMAGLPDGIPEDESDRAGCIIGVGMGGYGKVLPCYESLKTDGPEHVSPFVLKAMASSAAPAYVARRYGMQGHCYGTVSACTSGAHAVGEGFVQIAEGRADMMVCGGAEAGVNPLTVAGFAAMRALTPTHNDEPEKASRPFEKTRNGFVLAEGAGLLVLEDYEHAKSRGATILAEIVGYGASSDAHHITAPAEEGEGAQRAMRMALEQAGIEPTEVDYINAHGTSTPMNDVNEAFAIRSVFGDNWVDNGLMVSSTKSMTGHLLGGAGGIEAAITVLALHNQVVPPTLNYEEPDPDIKLDVVPDKPRKAKIRAALSNAFGFGGTNGSLLFKRAPEA